jgi:hypothetical protein
MQQFIHNQPFGIERMFFPEGRTTRNPLCLQAQLPLLRNEAHESLFRIVMITQASPCFRQHLTQDSGNDSMINERRIVMTRTTTRITTTVCVFLLLYAEHTGAIRPRKPAHSLKTTKPTSGELLKSSNKQPVFVKNNGQVRDQNKNIRRDVFFTAKVQGVTLYFRQNSVSYVFAGQAENVTSNASALNEKEKSQERTSCRMDLSLEGANAGVIPEGTNQAMERVNFYTPFATPEMRNIPTYNGIRYNNIYDNIDLVFMLREGRIKYEYVVHPGGDPCKIRMKYTGAQCLEMDSDGNLLIETPLGSITEDKPYTHQDGSLIDSRFTINQDEIGFALGKYNRNKDVTIDPWSTYYGGTESDLATSIEVDFAGNVYVSGSTFSGDFPVSPGAWQTILSGSTNIGQTWDAFILKFDHNGNRLWATYYGGDCTDKAFGIALFQDDPDVFVYVAGSTYTYVSSSNSFPTFGNVYQPGVAGLEDAFLLKFNGNGTLEWATLYGGSGSERANGVAVAPGGGAYITGYTTSQDLPVTNYYQGCGSLAGGTDGFIAGFSADGSTLLTASFLGGDANDTCRGIAVDGDGIIHVTGSTYSQNFPFVSNQSLSGLVDAILLTAVSGSTPETKLIGGLGEDYGYGVAVNNIGNVYVTGYTNSNDFPDTSGSDTLVGGYDAFIINYDYYGNWAHYLGGTDNDYGTGIATDEDRNIYITGYTFSTDFTLLYPKYMTNAGGADAFLAKYDYSSALAASTYYGASAHDYSYAVAVDGSNATERLGNAYIAGETYSGNLPVSQNAYQSANAGYNDAFIAGDFSISADFIACLQGPWNGTDMSTNLIDPNDSAYTYLPLTQPYAGSPWNYSGTENVPGKYFFRNSGSPVIVDWVLVVLRTPGSSTVVMRRAGFIRYDGHIVDIDGVSPLRFSLLNPDLYDIAIYHRNHLAIMTASSLYITSSSTVQYDFTTSQGQAYTQSQNPMIQVSSSPAVFALYACDENGNGFVNASDYYNCLVDDGQSGYLNTDYDLSSAVDSYDWNVLWRINNGHASQVP